MSAARLHRFVLAHLFTVVGEWIALIGVAVYAYQWGGATAVGYLSLVVHGPPQLGAPLAAHLTARYAPHTVRLWGFGAQAITLGAAAGAAAADLAAPVVTALVSLSLVAIHTLRPTGAVLLPAISTSTEELVRANLRVSYCDSVCGLVGPLTAAALAGLGQIATVFAVSAAGSVLAFVFTAWRPAPAGRVRPSVLADAPKRVMREVAAELRVRRWAVGVLGVSAARNLVIGAFDVLLVIVALQSLDLGPGGPGLLSGLVGGGAALSVVVITAAVRRARLRRALSVGIVVSAALLVLLGVVTERPVVFVALPLLGVCLSAMENLSRMLLQRSTDPRRLGPLFAGFGLVGGLSQLAGAGLGQVVTALVGAETGLVVVGGVLAVLALLTSRALGDADAHASVPVVEMSLLSKLPLFAPLHAASLEAVARAAEHQQVVAGDVLIRQGDRGDVFYAVVTGEFDIDMNGVFIRSAPQGDFFGEVALLNDSPRTATVTARTNGEMLVIHREPFLVAITGHEAAHAAATTYVVEMDLEEKMRRTSGGSSSAPS